jgi:putative two-component system response regulator
VGKIAIRDSILLKPGKLTPEEFEEMKKHTTYGVNIIKKLQKQTSESDFLSHARIFAGAHHERWDGKGYPEGLDTENIPLQGRLMAIADVYDALRSERPYKKSFSHREAVDLIMSERGSHFDPLLADIFYKNEEQFKEIKESS